MRNTARSTLMRVFRGNTKGVIGRTILVVAHPSQIFAPPPGPPSAIRTVCGEKHELDQEGNGARGGEQRGGARKRERVCAGG
jgi:hypothetical protein